MKNLNILISPLITDKTVGMSSDSKLKYVFWVDLRANKSVIKAIVEKIYDVKVNRVNVINCLGKVKRNRKGHIGKRSNRKKAIVTLSSGNIDFNKRG